ncbi:MAG: tRNA 5-methylaminomethyl-2-thiouridine biosynthesis bifunctional protein MnmC [Chlamydiae bacterium]|nr:tRNA 5-methylaminomethyl-2-thiouridine biosynthesis bifunctional protein MnmC [Chlamydiota bacterium]
MKKIAIIGAGFSGLALTYHLLQGEEESEITLFDGRGVGGGASGMASGLMHPFPGVRARLAWKGREGMDSSLQLLRLVGRDVFKETGILRLALGERQERDFAERANQEEDVEWWEAEKCRAYLPGGHYLPGIFIKSGVTVHAALYLKGLWKVCERLGAKFERREVNLQDLGEFDQVVLAAGGGIRKFNLGLDIKVNKGQILSCKKPNYWKPESSVIGRGYIALSEDDERCYLGSTYEHEFESEEPHLGVATSLIFKQLGDSFPSLSGFEVQGCLSGIRVANRKINRPIIGEVRAGLFVITAMGSRGLLYHSLLGAALARQMRSPQLERVV